MSGCLYAQQQRIFLLFFCLISTHMVSYNFFLESPRSFQQKWSNFSLTYKATPPYEDLVGWLWREYPSSDTFVVKLWPSLCLVSEIATCMMSKGNLHRPREACSSSKWDAKLLMFRWNKLKCFFFHLSSSRFELFQIVVVRIYPIHIIILNICIWQVRHSWEFRLQLIRWKKIKMRLFINMMQIIYFIVV